MKIYIHSSTTSTLTLYHGGKPPVKWDEGDNICMPDLGLHVGPLEVAENHDPKFIISVDFELKDVVEVEDQNVWNSPEATLAILDAIGQPMSNNELKELRQRRKIKSDNWRQTSNFYGELLLDNGVSIVKYINDIDGFGTENYMILDKSCIKSVKHIKIPNLETSKLDPMSKRMIQKIPGWAKDNAVDFRFSQSDDMNDDHSTYLLVMKPLPDDPDQNIKSFDGRGSIKELINKLNRYKSTHEASIARKNSWLVDYSKK